MPTNNKSTEADHATPVIYASPQAKFRSPEYKSWASMKDRCGRISHRQYRDYGGRGITICEEWLGSFETFLQDMGPRPSPAHSIDRIDNHKGYSPDNCRWATARQQSNNKRSNVIISVNGVTHTVAEWSRINGIKRSVIYQRLVHGWDDAQSVTVPVRPPHTITAHGVTQSIAEWAKDTGMTRMTITTRKKLGWSDEESVTLPAENMKRHLRKKIAHDMQ